MNEGFENSTSASVECDLKRQKFISVYPVDIWKSEGFFEDADVFIINCHWLQFEPIKPSIHLSLAIVYIVIFAIGSFSNVLVIYILLR